MGKEAQEGGICAYLELTHGGVQWKAAQHCKAYSAITPQLKKFFLKKKYIDK